MRNRKAPAPIMFMRNYKIYRRRHLDFLVKIFNSIYKTAKTSQEWLTSAFTPLPNNNPNIDKKIQLFPINKADVPYFQMIFINNSQSNLKEMRRRKRFQSITIRF